MSGLVVDTSVWIDFLAGHSTPVLEDALSQGTVVLTPLVVAELISGAQNKRDRDAIEDLITELPLHETPIGHWIRVGDLRRKMKARGFAVSVPDAHVAQCALDREAVLVSQSAQDAAASFNSVQ